MEKKVAAQHSCIASKGTVSSGNTSQIWRYISRLYRAVPNQTVPHGGNKAIDCLYMLVGFDLDQPSQFQIKPTFKAVAVMNVRK